MAHAGGTLDATARREVIEGVLGKLRQYYVCPEVARQMEEAIRRRLGNGEYDALTTGDALRSTLTAHLQEVSHDKHLRVTFSAEPLPPREAASDDAAWRAEYGERGSLNNFGFNKVERLPGNIGYLDLRSFYPPEIAGDSAVAALNLLAHTSALIVDLRKNGGGHPAMVALIATYLFDATAEQVHLNSLYWRARDITQQYWTLPYVPGRRYGGDKPVYVLTSARTFSGAEEFTYNLQNLKRATIVGETTGGGANPGDVYQITPHFEAFIPTGRAINPITNTSWEGTGVLPDIPAPREEALATARRAALKQIIAASLDTMSNPRRALLQEARAALAELEDGRRDHTR